MWAGSVYAQIRKMRELYDALPEKPEWLTAEAIDRYAAQMAAPYQVAAYHHFENGFDDKLDYQTLVEAEAAAQGYVAGTMEEDGFAYDGAAVYDAETRQCLRVYGNYPDEKAQEQATAFALEHDAVTPNSTELPAFLDMHLIEANLLDDGGRKHKRQEIFEYFQSHKSLAERTEFLKNSYNDIWVEVLTDGVRTGYHAEKDGLLMWEGSYLSRTSESVFSWSVITEMTEGLIERGEYKIKLGLQNAPVMAEQLALFDMGGDAPVYETPADTATGILAPARTVPQEVIDLALCTGGNEPNSAERIAVFYMREWPEQENEEFLRREFGTENGRGIEYEGRKYAVWFMEDGVHLAQGDSVRTGYSKTMVTWEQASARILELLEAGTYLSAAELAQAPDKVLHEAMDALLMTARDLNEEGRAQGLFPQTLAIHDQHKGYPELDEDMARSQRRMVAYKCWRRNTTLFSTLIMMIHPFCVTVFQRIAPTASASSSTTCHTRNGTLMLSPASCVSAKCSSHKTRSTVFSSVTIWIADWPYILTSAILTRRRNIRNSSRAALVSTAAVAVPDTSTRKHQKGWSMSATIISRNMIPSI